MQARSFEGREEIQKLFGEVEVAENVAVKVRVAKLLDVNSFFIGLTSFSICLCFVTSLAAGHSF